MKKFIDISEAPKTVAITFGRFNPPTIGHEKLCDAVRKANPSDYKIYASHSQNPKKDPLQYAKKIADGAPLSARWHKKFIYRLLNPAPLTDAEIEEGFDCYNTEDFQAGRHAFEKKSVPEFFGR